MLTTYVDGLEWALTVLLWGLWYLLDKVRVSHPSVTRPFD